MTDENEMKLKAVIDSTTLDTTLDILQSAGEEAVIFLGAEGLDTAIIDASSVMMHHVDVSPSGFERVPNGSFPIGTNLENLQDHISKAGAGQTVEIGYYTETRRLGISYDRYSSNLACIDPDSIRDGPDTTDLDLANSATIEASDLKDAVDHISLSSEHVKIEGDPSEEEVRIGGEGDSDESLVTLDHDDVITASVDKDCYSVYSAAYLKKLGKVLPSGEITLQWDDEFPMWIDYEYADGNAEVRTMMAPRVGEDA